MFANCRKSMCYRRFDASIIDAIHHTQQQLIIQKPHDRWRLFKS